MRAARELKDDVFRNLRFVAYPTPPFRQNDPLKILLANTDALKLSEYLWPDFFTASTTFLVRASGSSTMMLLFFGGGGGSQR